MNVIKSLFELISIDVEGYLLIGAIIFELILFIKTGIDLFIATWWGDDERYE